MKKNHLPRILLSTCLLALGGTSSGTAPDVLSKFEMFAASTEPAKTDWRRFHKFSTDEKSELWAYFAKQNKKLNYWHWGWRLAWVRSCEMEASTFCQEVLPQALQDRALFVRAEAADVIGRKYRNSQNIPMLNLLREAYKNPRNLRNGKPLIVQERILYAMKLIGGKEATDYGEKLANSSPKTLRYWRRIAM